MVRLRTVQAANPNAAVLIPSTVPVFSPWPRPGLTEGTVKDLPWHTRVEQVGDLAGFAYQGLRLAIPWRAAQVAFSGTSGGLLGESRNNGHRQNFDIDHVGGVGLLGSRGLQTFGLVLRKLRTGVDGVDLPGAQALVPAGPIHIDAVVAGICIDLEVDR